MTGEPYYQASKHIDWISASCVGGDLIQLFDDIETVEQFSPLKNYNRTIKYKSGVMQLYSTKNKKVGTHIIFSGEALGYMRGEGVEDIDLLNQLTENRFKLSRIDIALTFQKVEYSEGKFKRLKSDFTPEIAFQLAANGYMESKLQLDKPVTDNSPDKKVETCYIGSRISRNRLIRIYDKGIDLGGVADEIIRIEMQTNKNAQVIGRAIQNRQDIGSIIRRYVNFPTSPEWEIITGKTVAKMRHEVDTLSYDDKQANERAKKWSWIIDTAAKVLGRAIANDIETMGIEFAANNIDMFIQAVNDEIYRKS